jgi:hypothetical protein
VAEGLRVRSGAELSWNGEPCTPKRMEWLQRYPNLLAVELMQWLESKWEPAVRGGETDWVSIADRLFMKAHLVTVPPEFCQRRPEPEQPSS